MNPRERPGDQVSHICSPECDTWCVVDELTLINKHKDMNRWDLVIDCKHLEHKNEFHVEFLETDFVLCRDCVRRLYLVLRAMF